MARLLIAMREITELEPMGCRLIVVFFICRLELGAGNSELWDLQDLAAMVGEIAQANPN